MKKKLPVDQQAAALTEEQKKIVPKLFWIQMIAVTLAILVAIGISAEAIICRNNASKLGKDYTYSVEITGNPILFAEEFDRWVEASDAAQAALVKLVVTCSILFVALLVMSIYISKKHPYYSDKLYFYLRKHK